MGAVVAGQEQSWVVRARQGDQEAFAKLVGVYQMPVFNLAYRMLGGSGEAEDAAQETFLRAYTALASYDPSRKFSSWILSIASHYCVDRLRRRRGGVHLSIEEDATAHWIPDERPLPEEETLEHEQRAAIQGLLAQLSSADRLVIVLRYWHDLSYDEIAEMTHTSESAVKSRLHRARALMAAQLDEDKATGNVAQSQGRRVPEHAMSRSY
jgi:RNA polymerase sigma-70 factor, ECF subfamily